MVDESFEDLVNTTESANMCGVSLSTISKWVERGYLTPTGLDESHRPLYLRIDVLRAARDTRRRAIGKNRIA